MCHKGWLQQVISFWLSASSSLGAVPCCAVLCCVWFPAGSDPSAEGVQRDLLPLIEGSVISTKHGPVATDHILFIASGAFTSAKPSDMMAELQVGLHTSRDSE